MATRAGAHTVASESRARDIAIPPRYDATASLNRGCTVMASVSRGIGAPYCMMITFEIAPEDEAEFNDIYDNDHIPTIMKLDGVTEVIRFRDPGPNDKGYLVYSALYFMTKENLHLTSAWKSVSDP